MTFYDNNINGRKVIDFGVATMVDISSEYRKKHYFVSVSTLVHSCDVYMYTKSIYICGHVFGLFCFGVRKPMLYTCTLNSYVVHNYDVYMYTKFT